MIVFVIKIIVSVTNFISLELVTEILETILVDQTLFLFRGTPHKLVQLFPLFFVMLQAFPLEISPSRSGYRWGISVFLAKSAQKVIDGSVPDGPFFSWLHFINLCHVETFPKLRQILTFLRMTELSPISYKRTSWLELMLKHCTNAETVKINFSFIIYFIFLFYESLISESKCQKLGFVMIFYYLNFGTSEKIFAIRIKSTSYLSWNKLIIILIQLQVFSLLILSKNTQS